MAPTCFGLRTSSGSLQLSLAKVILTLKHSVKLRRYLLCGCVAACPSMLRVLCAVQSKAHSARSACPSMLRVLCAVQSTAHSARSILGQAATQPHTK